MTDYKKATGSSATMMIRDTGSVVEFWINSNNSSTWNSALPWGYTVNGVTGSGTKSYSPGAGWVKLGAWTVTTNQTVTFRLGASGTSGFGGPTTFSVAISRTSAPSAPSAFVASVIAGTSITGDFNGGSNGGSPINSLRVGWGTSATAPQHFTAANASGGATITGLTPGTTYYFWAQTHNAIGYSPYGPRSSYKTLSLPGAPPKPTISLITPGSFYVRVRPPVNGGSAITGYEFAVGKSSDVNAREIWLASSIPERLVEGRVPGTQYYVWVRAKNSYGWGPWSPSATVTTLSGAYIYNGTMKVWMKAVPYVNVGGVWKPAQAWRKNVGYWNPTL
jgi:hypothetical protein